MIFVTIVWSQCDELCSTGIRHPGSWHELFVARAEIQIFLISKKFSFFEGVAEAERLWDPKDQLHPGYRIARSVSVSLVAAGRLQVT